MDHSSLKNSVRTWNNGPSASTMYDCDCGYEEGMVQC